SHTSPGAFPSSHAIESKFTPQQWCKRVWRDDAVVLVCVAHPLSSVSEPISDATTEGGDGVFEGTWVGIATMRGPIPASEYALPAEAGAPTKWQMTAVFASAGHRGQGVGKKLIQAAKDYALAQTMDPRLGLVSAPVKVRFRVLIHPNNLPVIKLYAGAGFVDAGRATGKEAYRTNGDLASWVLKLDTLNDEEKVYWSTQRVAVALEWTNEVQVP
ncbi:hypothetical protein B0H10DRAFT_2006947, partial [Mycena sp. CBHHK59/15]